MNDTMPYITPQRPTPRPTTCRRSRLPVLESIARTIGTFLVCLAPCHAGPSLPAAEVLIGEWCLVETTVAGESARQNASWTFGSDGRYRVRMGSSQFSGEYRLQGNTLRASPYTLKNVAFAADTFTADFNGRARFTRGACPVPKLDFDGHMALIKAVRLGQLDEIRRLIAQAQDPNVTEPGDLWGHTPLHVAAKFDAAPSARLLLSLGADPSRADAAGDSPLDIAVKKRAVAIARVLLQAGADPNRADEEGRTPLMFAIGHDDTAMAALLLEYGAHADARFSHSSGRSVSLREYAQMRPSSPELIQLLNRH